MTNRSHHTRMTGLRLLAKDCGLQGSYTDAFGTRRTASTETVIAVLRALVGLDDPADASDLLAERRQVRGERLLDPVAVRWGTQPLRLRVQLPELERPVRISVTVSAGGDEVTRVVEATVVGAGAADPDAVVIVEVGDLPELPVGYHRVRVEAGGRTGDALLMVAPLMTPPLRGRSWGTFLPAYAARSDDDWGVGDFGSLAELMAFTADRGGDLFSTLPLLAQFLAEPFEPSPYSPASRLFWNDLYLDVEAAVAAAGSTGATSTLEASALGDRVRTLRRAPRVRYREAMAAKRVVLQVVADELHQASGPLRDDLEAFAGQRPDLDTYARYRAEVELRGCGWTAWPGGVATRWTTDGSTAPSWRYHRAAQWLADRQLRAAVDSGRDLGVGLLLDLPLGVHVDAYDVFAHRELFVVGTCLGAPPDRLFKGGQQWGLPPLHPERIRESGYAYPVAAVRRLAELAGVLRIDHVMALHRQYWVPEGHDWSDGVYVRSEPDEWYALLAIEADRAGCAIVGEDLGTVPPGVRPAMRSHGVSRYYTVLGSVADVAESPLGQVPDGAQASVDTHDTGPFAAFWAGEDVSLFAELGILTEKAAHTDRRGRELARVRIVAMLVRDGWLEPEADPLDSAAVLRALHAWLAASPAGAVVVNLEDLWGERFAHNVPGTSKERPNWRGRSRLTVGEMAADASVRAALAEVAAARAGRA